jgi:hypothetical protein
MKNGTATSAYDVSDLERTINPTEDNDLLQIGYKPELEVTRMPYSGTLRPTAYTDQRRFGLWAMIGFSCTIMVSSGVSGARDLPG